jgi:hypothetical protein
MTRHTPELHNSVTQAQKTTGAQTPEGRAFILDWVARNQKRLAAGLGTTALMLPFLAEAQAVGPLVNVLDLAGVRSAALNADGSAQLVLANGQQVQIAASAVQVGANGAVFVTQAAAQMVAEVVASVAAAGGGAVAGTAAAGGFGGGAAAAGLGLGVAAAGAAAGGGGGGSAPEQLLSLNIQSFAAPQSLSQIFGSAAADVLETDSVTVTLGTGSAAQVLNVSYSSSESAWQIDTITGNVLEALLQGRQPLSFTATRTPAEGPETEITGSVNAAVDTIAPEIAITAVAGGDAVLNAGEQADALVVSGTSTAENGQVVTVQVLDGSTVITTGTAIVTNGIWSAQIGATALQDAQNYQLSATVSDAAGNPAASPATGSLATDFTATISIDTVPELTTAATFSDLVLTGTSSGVEAGRPVFINFAGTDYAATIDSSGNWTTVAPHIPQSELARLRDAGTSPIPLSVFVTDEAGNLASALAPITPSYSTPSLTITTPSEPVVLNATTVGAPLVISGQTVPGASVVVQIGPDSLPAVTADSAGNWTATATSLPGDGSYTITASATLNSISVASPATLGLVIDTAAPVVTITTAGVGTDGVLNAAERAEGFTISGTVSDAGTADLTTLQLTVELVVGSNPPIPLQATITEGGNWTAPVPAASALADGATIQINASATDAAGNSDAPQTASFTTDYTASITLDTFTITTVNTFTGLTVTGTTDGVEQTQPVTLSLGGAENYTGQVGMDGTWSVQIPASDITALGTGTAVTATVSVSDSAGNPASATASTETDFSQPPLSITSPAAGSFINAATAGDELVISGLAIPGQDVTLVTPNVSGGLSAAADSETGAWSITIPNGALPGTDGQVALEVSITIGGVSEQANLTLTRDTDAPSLTMTTQVSDGALVISGTVSTDVGQVRVTIDGQQFLLSPFNFGQWSLTLNEMDLPTPSGSTVEVLANASDTAGNPAPQQAATLNVPSVDFGATSVVVGADAFVNGFSVSGSTSNMAEGSIVTVTSTDNPATFSTTATVQNDGSWTATFPASAVQQAADGANLQLSATVTGTSYPVTRSNDAFTASVNIPVTLSVDPIGTDGALILSETGDITLSGRTSGVQQGQIVTITTGGTQVGTATVGADGTWTTTIARPSIAAGEAVSYSFEVSNASETKTANATGDLVGYLPSVFSALYLDGTSPLEFFVNTELENVASGGISFFTFDMSYDTTVVSLRPATTEDVEGQQVATGGLNSGFSIGDRVPNTDSGEVTVVAARLTGQITNFDAEPVYTFEMDHINPSGMIIITLSDVQVNRDAQQNPIQVGSSVSYTGTNGADTITAANVDTFIRGRGGDDTINVSATGVNTIVFEPDPAANGVDQITGFTVGGALADRIAFAFSDGAPASALRGAGTMFELRTGDASSALGADVGLVVLTTEVDDTEANAVLQDFGLQAGDVIYVLSADEDGATLVQITFNDLASFDPDTDIRDIASFSDLTLADLAQFSSANILGFSEYT